MEKKMGKEMETTIQIQDLGFGDDGEPNGKESGT